MQMNSHFVYIIITPQMSFGQSDCSICGQYDMILPVVNEKYHSDALLVLECKQNRCSVLGMSLLCHIMM